MLRDLLRLWGHEVLEAADGTTGLDLLRRERLDVAIIDVGLPGLTGYQVVEQFRAGAGDGRPRLIALTGYGREEDRRRALDAGFDTHCVKPVDVDRLQKLLGV